MGFLYYFTSLTVSYYVFRFIIKCMSFFLKISVQGTEVSKCLYGLAENVLKALVMIDIIIYLLSGASHTVMPACYIATSITSGSEEYKHIINIIDHR